MVTSLSKSTGNRTLGSSIFDELYHRLQYIPVAMAVPPPEPAVRQALARYSLLQAASNEVGDRPGRIEPRVVKRRPKPYDQITKPRHQYTQRKP